MQDWIESTTGFVPFATADQLVLPGHKLPYRGLPFRLTQLVANHQSALDRLRTFLAVPATAVQCFAPLFRREIGAGEYGLALVEAVAHMNYLLHRGEVSRSLRADGAWVFVIHN
ncbi:MAG: hypothetical protein H7173_10895 [Rhodoferax sp.]|nr:hypothetical protein [Pseudorhodobacter sp.]